MQMYYPDGWPQCACGAPVLDGHLTCGQATCQEGGARHVRERAIVEMTRRLDALRRKREKPEGTPQK